MNGKRKTVGVFINRTGYFFENSVYANTQKYARQHNFNVLLFTTLGYRASVNYFDELEKAMFAFAPVEQLDGIIIAPDTYQMEGFYDLLFDMLEKRVTCPVVSIRDHTAPYDRVATDEENAIRPLLKHLIEEHGYKRIHFLAGFQGHPDSEARLRCYYEEMAAHNLPLPKNAVHYGTMWRSKGDEACDAFLQEGLPIPEVIVCANDHMAMAIIEELNKRGLRVPDDICVTGFDNIVEPTASPIHLTTVEQDYDLMVERAFERLAYQMERREQGLAPAPQLIDRLPAKLYLRDSCGCYMTAGVYDQYDKLLNDSRQMQHIRNRETSQMYFSIDMNAATAVADIHNTIVRKCGDVPQMRDFFLCLFENHPGTGEAQGYAERMTDHVSLVSVLRDHRDGGMPMESFNRAQLLPDWVWDTDEPQAFFVRLLHQWDSIYGYSLVRYDEGEIPSIFYHHWNVTISSALRHLFDQQKLRRLYEERRLSSITDPLTGLYNRRGLEELTQPEWENRCQRGESVAVLSFDMDNLKPINDSHGHIAGDRALQTVARALRMAEKEGAVSARIGGDEFVLFLPDCDMESATRAMEGIDDLLVHLNKRNGTPFAASVSSGCYAAKLEPGMTLEQFIRESDDRMYAVKHQRRKKQYTSG